jgi:Na+-driven multidrug efflux pump
MQDLTIGNEGKLIFKFAAPMLLGNLFQQMFSVADRIVVGKFVGNQGSGRRRPLLNILIICNFQPTFFLNPKLTQGR